jgi:ribosome modulation factor
MGVNPALEQAIQAGRAAFHAGQKLKDNPHKSPVLSGKWSQGWREASAEKSYNKSIAKARSHNR